MFSALGTNQNSVDKNFIFIDGIKMVPTQMEFEDKDWIYLDQDNVSLLVVVNAVINLWVP